MSGKVHVRLKPLGAAIEVEPGAPLQDILFPYGVEFPCGGRAQCKGCRVRVLEGSLPATPEQRQMLSEKEIAAGWRLSCQCRAESDLTLELAQWEAAILSDNAPFPFIPRDGYGVAIDLGTTTIVAQLLDLRTANVMGVRTALNRQAKHGADVMSRISFAVAEKKQHILTAIVREQIASMVQRLLDDAGVDPSSLRDVVIVGNTVMHHLFCGIDCAPLSHYPFEPAFDGRVESAPADLGWHFPPEVRIQFLPCLGGFVGSDILAGIIATDMQNSPEPCCLIDLGTNGEIVVGSRDGLRCCSTAAGPAFEGARIYMGMRAATGAIVEVHASDTSLACKVLGGTVPRGICGSGLVDAAAALLDLGVILPGGRFSHGEKSVMLADPVKLSQTDIRELQLAKGAIAAGIRILLNGLRLEPHDIRSVYLAGAFGNYVNRASAFRIGLIGFPPAKVIPAGNTALRGAKWALYTDTAVYAQLAQRVKHVSLHAHQHFQDIYVEEMAFPGSQRSRNEDRGSQIE